MIRKSSYYYILLNDCFSFFPTSKADISRRHQQKTSAEDISRRHQQKTSAEDISRRHQQKTSAEDISNFESKISKGINSKPKQQWLSLIHMIIDQSTSCSAPLNLETNEKV
ncbi:hypothetical protein NPX99_05290 [Bartonella sp. 220]|uniref:hypothetical protein n=1 Tax=Bartonella sp. 220B TaxID=2967260 RepID=UPI0022A9ABC2|nr:hypothetical protein [Bartonella sp. 220B]MCZ2158689.1 hypothetical protein [Bartonella sp. 220B]